MQDFASFIQTLKERNDIVEVIGSYIKLERRGYNYWACCPFHHEKTPSFSINAADRYYHCFGCGVSGDVIGFVKEYENVDFNQAVEILAKRAGLEVPARDEKTAELAALKKKKRDRHVALMKDAARFYLGNLYSGRADAYLSYLAKRGVTPSLAKKFGIGASLDFNGLPAHLLALGYTKEECAESGACGVTDDGRLFDFEGGRLIIPIINSFDEVIAFGGRVMQPTDRAKYKNTRETLLFNKSKNLYNINLVKKEKRAGGLPYLIMVEGYMDAISLYAAGFRNVVASMGTSLTKEQVRLAKRYTDTVLISYDGDAAGQSANLRGLKLLEDEGMKLRVVPLPDELDPDDVIRRRGAEGYQACLDAAMPLIDFRLHAAAKKYDLSKTDEVRDFVREALTVVRESDSETEREELLKRVSQMAGVSLGALQRDLERLPENKEGTVPLPTVRKEEGAGSAVKAARYVLCACLLSKPYALGFDLTSLEWDMDEHKTVADFVMRERQNGRVRASGIFDYLPENGEIASILNLDFGDNLEGEGAEKYFRDCVRTLQKHMYARKIAEEQEAFRQAQSAEEKREILLRIGEYTKKMKNIGGNV